MKQWQCSPPATYPSAGWWDGRERRPEATSKSGGVGAPQCAHACRAPRLLATLLARLLPFVLYLMLAPLLYRLSNDAPGIAFLSVLPVMAIAWQGGPRAGLLAVLIATLCNLTLFALWGVPPARALPAQVLGSLALLLIAWITGQLRHNQRLLAMTSHQQQSEQQALRDSEQRYRTLFNQTPIGIFLYDTHFTLTECNERLAELLHLPHDRMVGWQLDELRDQRVVPAMRRALSGENVIYEGPYEAVSGGVSLEISLKVSPLRDSEGLVVGGIGLLEDITARKRAEWERRESEARFRLMVEGSEQVFFYLHDTEHRFLYLSPSVRNVLGYEPEELVGKPYDVLLTGDESDSAIHVLTSHTLQGGGSSPAYTAVVHHRDGRFRYLELVEGPVEEDGQIIGMQGFARDVTERKQAERLQAVLYEVAEAVHETPDLTTLFHSIHRSLGRILNVRNFYVALCDEEEPDTFCFAYEVDAHDRFGPGDYHLPGSLTAYVAHTARPLLVDTEGYETLIAEQKIRRYGMPPRSWLGVPLRLNEMLIGVVVVQSYEDGELYSARDVEMMSFVSNQIALAIERKRTEQALRESRETLHFLAHHDILTELPNRLLFYDRLRHAVSHATRYNHPLALLYIDLDGFKEVNDSLGHDAGDELLRQVAERLNQCVRSSDTVARIGGDEFTIILSAISRPDDVRLVAEKVMESMREPFHIFGRDVTVTSSIGSSLYPDNSRDLEELIKQADSAMYQAKEGGKDRYHLFSTG